MLQGCLILLANHTYNRHLLGHGNTLCPQSRLQTFGGLPPRARTAAPLYQLLLPSKDKTIQTQTGSLESSVALKGLKTSYFQLGTDVGSVLHLRLRTWVLRIPEPEIANRCCGISHAEKSIYPVIWSNTLIFGIAEVDGRIGVCGYRASSANR